MERVLLTDVCNFQYGYAFDSRKFSNEGKVPLVRIRDVVRGYSETYTDEDFDDNYLVHDGDMLIGMDGEFNIAYWHGGDAALNQRVCKLVPSDKVDSAYIFYRMVSVLKQIESKTPFVTVKHLSAKELNAVYIDLPNISEQEMQGKKLRYIDGLIAKNDSKLKIMDILVKSRFIEMFGNPLTNPMNWDIRTVGELSADVKYGTSSKASDVGKYKYLRMNNLTYDGYIDLSDLKYIDMSDEDLEKCVVRKGDILFNRTNSSELVGKTAYFDFDEDMVIAGYIIRVRLNDCMSPIFFARFMNLEYMKRQLRSMAKGAVNQANINAQELKSIEVYVPPIDLQNQFADFVAQTDKSKLAVQQSIETLQTLKANLMQEYFG